MSSRVKHRRLRNLEKPISLSVTIHSSAHNQNIAGNCLSFKAGSARKTHWLRTFAGEAW
jgi:hypothetical protein